MIIKHEKGFLPIKILIIIGLVLLLLVGGGLFTYLKFFTSKNNSKQQTKDQPPESEETANLPGPIFDLETFIVNLVDDSGRRYLKTNINIELTTISLEEEIKQKMPLIQDAIIGLLSSKSYDDIADISGKLSLRTQIIKRLNDILTAGKIQKVYFTNFVIQ